MGLLLTGATGNTGSEVAKRLKARGVPFVAMVRSDAAAAKLGALGYPTVRGDFDDPASLRGALAGVDTAYLVSTPDEGLVPHETAFVQAAREAGVNRVVKCSAYRSAPDSPSPNLRAHAAVEELLRQSGMRWTIVRPHGFMQTFTLFSWDLIHIAGAVSANNGDGAMPLVDVRDVAEVVVKVLTEADHDGRTYEVTGPEALTMWDMADTLSKVLGKPVCYVESDDRSTARVMDMLGVPPAPRDHVLAIAKMTRDHQIDRVHPTLRELGITPTPYEQFVRDYVAGETTGGNSFRPPDTLKIRALSWLMPRLLAAQLAVMGRPKRPSARPG